MLYSSLYLQGSIMLILKKFSQILISWIMLTSPLMALDYGNPVSHFGQGDIGIGLSVSNEGELVFIDYGVVEHDALRILTGNVEKEHAEGTVIGVGYRHQLGMTFDLFDQNFQTGILGYYSSGTVEEHGHDIDFSQIDLGIGATFEPVQHLLPYLVVALRQSMFDEESDTEVGIALGIDYGIGENFVVGAEYQPIFEEVETALFVEVIF